MRRKELDEKLERARASLSALAVQEAPSLHGEHTYQAPTEQSGSTIQNNGSNPGGGARDLSVFLNELAELATATFTPRSRSPWPRFQVDWNQVEAAISAEEEDPELDVRLPRDQGQLERTTRTIESLVQTLLWQTRNPDQAPQSNIGHLQGGQSLSEAEELMSGYPSYSSPHIEPEAASHGRAQLSETFRSIFNRATDAKEAVGKICYNLLLSTTPPNIHNYNTLIAGFNRIHRPDLAQAVINSYLDETKWPATQQTLVCLLEHARETNDLGLFKETIGRMRGTVEDGVHLRIFSKEAIYDDVGFAWVQKYATSRKNAYVERAHRNQEVFNSMIRGWLQFGKVDIASMSFVACVRNQFFVPVDTVHDLLTQCLTTLNQKTARTMLDRLGKDLEKFELLLQHIVTESTAQMASKIGELFGALFNLSGFVYKPVFSGARRNVGHLLEMFREHVGASNADPTSEAAALARIAALAKECQSLEEKNKRLEAHVKVLSLNHKTGYDLNASNRLPPIDWQNRTRHEHYPPLTYALQVIDLKSTMTTQNCIKIRLLSQLPNQAVAKKLKAAANLDNLSVQSLISFYHPLQKRSWTPAAASEGDIGSLERQASNIEQNIQAILFCQLTSTRQRSYRTLYQDWFDMPVEKLAKHIAQSLVHRVRVERKRKLQDCAIVQHENNEVDEVADGSSTISRQALPWDGEASPPHTYVEMSLPVAKSAAMGLSASGRQLWSEERLDVTRHQQAEASC